MSLFHLNILSCWPVPSCPFFKRKRKRKQRQKERQTGERQRGTHETPEPSTQPSDAWAHAGGWEGDERLFLLKPLSLWGSPNMSTCRHRSVNLVFKDTYFLCKWSLNTSQLLHLELNQKKKDKIQWMKEKRNFCTY